MQQSVQFSFAGKAKNLCTFGGTVLLAHPVCSRQLIDKMHLLIIKTFNRLKAVVKSNLLIQG